MKTIKINLYSFSELSKEGQKKAIENLSDINLEWFDWWEAVYEDAENIGLKITSFDIDRANYCNGEFISGAMETAKLIIAEHGEQCETYKTAQTFLSECEAIEQKAKLEGKDGDEEYWFEDEIEDCKNDFLKSLCEDYKVMLKDEFEYLQSEQAIKETIESNDYTFKMDGTIFNG